MPRVHASAAASPRNDGRLAADYSPAVGKNTQTTTVRPRPANHDTVILKVGVMVRSVLYVLQGHGIRSHSDRDGSGSRARGKTAWVRTNPQTPVR